MIDRELLFKPRTPEAEVDVPGLGTMRVRGLTRAEIIDLRDVTGQDFERKALTLGVLDPELTEDGVAEWQAVAMMNEIEAVIGKITDLSGLGDRAAKDAYEELESASGAEFRDVPSEGTGDDGGEDAGGDA